MLGSKILELKIRWQKGHNGTIRKSIPYKEVKRIAVIIKNDSSKNNSSIENLINGFKVDSKLIEVLCYQKDIINSKYNFPFFSFSHKDLKWNGAIDNDHFKRITETPFDYLLLLTDEIDNVQRFLLLQCNAKLRIINKSEQQTYFDMKISSINEKDFAASVDAISNYIRQIR